VHTHVIAALDTPELEEAKAIVERLSPFVFAFKIGHALVLPYGLKVIEELQTVGAKRIFLDMKFHDIPTSVALGVYEATRMGVWMMTLHASGGKAMMAAAVEAVSEAEPTIPPILLGVTLLTSIDDEVLNHQLGIEKEASSFAHHLGKLAIESGLDGLVCSGHEVARFREELGHEPILVVPGIRPIGSPPDEQRRVTTAGDAISAGANYVVIGRYLTSSDSPEKTLEELGL